MKKISILTLVAALTLSTSLLICRDKHKEVHKTYRRQGYECPRWRNYQPIWWMHNWYGRPCKNATYRCQIKQKKVLDLKGFEYWEVYNATDRTLQFHTKDKSAILAPGKKAKIMRGRSFDFAVTSKNGKLLTEGKTQKHFITIFHRGYATAYNNKHFTI